MADHKWFPWQPLRYNMLLRPPTQHEASSSSGVPVRASMDTQTIVPPAPFANYTMPIGCRMPGPSIVPPAPFVMNHRPPAFPHYFAPIRLVNMSLPPNACDCLCVTGVPLNSSRREIAHIFRPFKGYIRVRVSFQNYRPAAEDPILLCFVDFENSYYAAAAMMALQAKKHKQLESAISHEPIAPHFSFAYAPIPSPSGNPFEEDTAPPPLDLRRRYPRAPDLVHQSPPPPF